MCVCICQRDNSVQSNDNVVVITPQLMSMAHDLRRTVTSHLLPGFIRSADFDNDLVLDTTNMQTTIRLNVYHLRHKVLSYDACFDYSGNRLIETNNRL